jgi:ATP-binding cassette subfamily B protein
MGAALWHSIRFAYRAEPRLLLVSFALVVSSWLPDAFGALWLKLLADGALAGDGRRVAWAAAGLAGSGEAAWLLRIAGDRVHFLFRERATIAIEAHVARLQATVASIEHHERPEYLDRLQILRDQAFLLNHLYHSFMSTVGSVARLAITIALLASRARSAGAVRGADGGGGVVAGVDGAPRLGGGGARPPARPPSARARHRGGARQGDPPRRHR